MGISYIPGPEQLLNPAVAEISDAVGEFLQPHKKFQKAVQMAMINNPQLIQQFADIEANAPGTLERLGFGGIGGTVSQTSQSAAGRAEAAMRPRAGEQATAGQDAQIAKSQFDAIKTKAAIDLIRAKPELNFRAAYKEITGETEEQTRVNKVKADVTEAEAPGALRAINQSTENLGDTSKIDLMDAARRFYTGKMNAQEMGTLLLNPSTSKPFSLALEGYQAQQERIAREAAAAYRGSQKTEDVWAARGVARYADSQVGDPETWTRYMQDGPKARERVRQLKARPPQSLTAEESSYLEIARYDESQRVQQGTNLLRSIQNAVRPMLKTLREGEFTSESERDELVAAINDQLTHNATVTGRKIKLVYDNGEGLFNMAEFMFIDETTKKEVTESEALPTYIPTEAAQGDALIDAAVTAILSVPSDSGRTATLEQARDRLRTNGNAHLIPQLEKVLNDTLPKHLKAQEAERKKKERDKTERDTARLRTS